MLRHIAWFSEAAIEPDPAGGLRSADLRVVRRMLLPAAELEKHGVACSVFGNLPDADANEIAKLLQNLNADIVVVGVFSDPTLVKLARAAKHLGCYIVADFADQTSISADFEKLAALADCVVAAPVAADVLKAAGIEATLIGDAGADGVSASVAAAWLDCLKHLKSKPPLCANTNIPPEHA